MKPSSQTNLSAPSKRGQTRKRKRTRGQKPKDLVVLSAGDEPRVKHKKDGQGRPRYFDIAPSTRREAAPSKREREFLQRIAQFKTKQNDEKDLQTDNRITKKKKQGNKFEGMREGEGLHEFARRLKKESLKVRVQIAKKDNHQREKKRKFYEKKKEAAKKRKLRKNRGAGFMDDDDEQADRDDLYQEISHLPGYWQEIVRNGGRPITEKQRKTMRRAEREEDDTVGFGEQAERPPKLSVLPVRRGRSQHVAQ